MVRYDILIEDTGETYRCAETRSLLEGMEAFFKGKKSWAEGLARQ